MLIESAERLKALLLYLLPLIITHGP